MYCYTATWALGPVCGLNNKQAMVRVVLQLLHHTVEANGMQMKRALALEGETLYHSRGGSPRLADARLGSAHARNNRECRQIAAVNATAVLPGGVHKKSGMCISSPGTQIFPGNSLFQPFHFFPLIFSHSRIKRRYLGGDKHHHPRDPCTT